ncbi:MAG: hypothetical protein AAF500_16415 [Myxococcota bacterium]
MGERCGFYKKRLSDWFDEGELQTWQRAIGELEWSEVDRDSPTFIAWGEGHRNRIFDVWNAVLLSDPSFRFHWRAWSVAGEVQLDSQGRPEQLLSASRLNTQPETFPRRLHRPPSADWQSDYKRHWDRFLAAWEPVEAVGGFNELPILLRLAINCHTRGWTSDTADFRIPNFVRSAEAILAIPRGGGASEYARRASAVAFDSILADDLVTWEKSSVEGHLNQLYRHRNDCVHGKLPFHTLLGQGQSGEHEVEQYEYVAELVSRHLIGWALARAEQQLFESRDTLERAWEQHCPPDQWLPAL